jgi:MSHA biogenesis protein MshL
MTTTWCRTLGAALVVTGLSVTGLRAQEQAAPRPTVPQRPAQASPPPLPPLPITQIDTRLATPARGQEDQAQPARPPAPQPLSPVPATQLDERLPASRAGQNFSLSFSEAQPIREVLLLMLKDTGLSVAIDPDATGTFTGELADVTLKQALDITLPPLALDYTLENKVLHVFRRPTETRFFTVNYVATRRSGERTTSAPTGLAGASRPQASGAAGGLPGPAAGASVTSSDVTDFYDELSSTVRALLSAEGRFTIDRKAGLVQVTDYADRLERVSHYLELAELRATRQVQIEATFLEVDLNEAASAGINWSTVFTAAGAAVKLVQQSAPADPGQAFTLGVRVVDLDGLLKAFATQGNVTVLARPRVAAMNNEPAIIRASTQHVVPGAASPGRGAAGGERQMESTPQTITDGVVLTVTPQISADGVIHMSVAPTVARQSGDGAPPRGAPAVMVRGADTLVRVHEGETILLGGLMQAPSQGDKTTGDKARGRRPAARRTELVILLTPTII